MVDNFGILERVPEADDEPYVEFDISVSPSHPTLESLANKIANGDMIVPFYQRRFEWKIPQASKLIESFLMGLQTRHALVPFTGNAVSKELGIACGSSRRSM